MTGVQTCALPICNWTVWYENGQKRSEGNYKDDKGEGKWTLWDKDGQEKSEGKGTQTVKISDINIPFDSMVIFMVKWVIASIPAIIILMILFAIFGGLLAGIISIFN